MAKKLINLEKKEKKTNFIQSELEWLKDVLIKRSELVGTKEDISDSLMKIELPDFSNNQHLESTYASLINKHKFNFIERAVLILALAPHLYPKKLEIFFQPEKIMTGWGGKVSADKQYFIPTGETVMFIFAGNDLQKRFELLELFDKDHIFYKENLISLNNSSIGEPELSGILKPSKDLIDLATRGEVKKPDLSADFPAKLITTDMDWEDLVVPKHTREQLNEIQQWIDCSHELVSDPQLGKKIKLGFKVLFYGSPGTGKTLAATLIGKKTGRDVYRIDLSTVVSKYIGETEKNLSKLFDRAERKNWILFFDEADALFGKRTNVKDSHDRYANQEVSYLLQRIEYFDGMIILATNMKSNIDSAFMRRFQNIVHFPIPKADERLTLWKNTFPERIWLDDTVDLQKLANDHELTGAHIANIVSHCALKAIANGTLKLSTSLIRESIARELGKEGLTL